MIQSASILPLTEELSWGRAIPPGSFLSSVDPVAPIDVTGYRKRDQELAYRDLVIGALLTQVVIKIGDVWQFKALRPQLPATVTGTLNYTASDSPPSGVSLPGSVTHVKNNSIPFDAFATDKFLYARDAILYEALRSIASVLLENPIADSGPVIVPSEAWSIAEGVQRILASAGYNLPLNVNLFKHPDTDLANRDTQLAVFISQLQLALNNVFSRATRLLVKAPGQEPDVYVLTQETDRIKLWSAFPLLSDGRLQVKYDKLHKTVSWLGEQPVASNPFPQALTVPVAGGDLSIIGASQDAPDAEFYRQKAARLHTRPYVDRIIFQTSDPELYLTNGGIYQPSAVLLAIPGQLLFSLPILIPAGCARIGIQVMPSQFISILGFLNRTRQADGTAVTLPENSSITYDVPLPMGRILVQLEITDKTALTPAFNLEITANDNLVFDGAFTFNKAPGQVAITQSFELDNSEALAPGNVVIVIKRLKGSGNLTINRLTFTTPVPGPDLTYAVSLSIGSNITSPIQLKGITERQDTVWFDTLIPAQISNPIFGISFSGGNNAALYINSYDIRIFDVLAALPNAASYEPHKVTLANKALESTQHAWYNTLITNPNDTATIIDNERVWDADANLKWLSLIEFKEPRLFDAFDVAGPGDIGRPAFIPDGLVLDGDKGDRILATLQFTSMRPVFKTLQAWMLDFNPRVVGPDFWPQSDAGCASIGNLSTITVTADFDWALTLPSNQIGYITFLSALSQLGGSPNGNSFTAYTITNTGPSGGTIQQTVTLTVGLANLNLGASYNLTLTLIRQLLNGGTQTTYTVVLSVSATDISMSVTLPAIVAPTGYSVTVQSIILS